MKNALISVYYRLTLGQPKTTLIAVFAVLAFFSWFIKDFKLDASGDALILETDQDYQYFQAINAKYPGDDFVVVTYAPKTEDLFSPQVRERIKSLRDELKSIDIVASVTTYLDVPLINSPAMTFSEIAEGKRSLEMPGVDVELARQEFKDSPIYRNMLVSPSGKTTALQIVFRRDEQLAKLQERRNALQLKRAEGQFSEADQAELSQITNQFKIRSGELQDQEAQVIQKIRTIIHRYRDHANIHLGGVPMIVADMISYIANDIRVFGIGVVLFIIFLLFFSFKKPRWVVIPVVVCLCSVLGMVGYLGLLDWRVTVVSSNFISLLLIITLSLTVHLIVRYQELHSLDPNGTQKEFLTETINSKIEPSIYTVTTTMVAFGSLLVSGIRPVIDFGWMMVFGVGLAFVLAFLIIPSALVLMRPGEPIHRAHDATGAVTRFLGEFVQRRSNLTLLFFVGVVIFTSIGISKMSVENRFIDYFKESTEIFQGMIKIDQELGGTTPLEVILDPTEQFWQAKKQEEQAEPTSEEEFDLEAELGGGAKDDAGISGTSYWFNVFELETIRKVHDYLDSLPQTGKVLSLASTMDMMKTLNGGKELDNIVLAVLFKRIPDDIKQSLFDPYMTEDGNQVRFTIRVFESDYNLKRKELIAKIKKDLVEKIGLSKEQVHVTGMVVLYNNMLQSLFRSQILTIGVVFLAIMLMFLVLFRSAKISLIAIIPNMVAASLVLGMLGWLGIPLDIMTITIAAITIGIAVDNSIHYIYRYLDEYKVDQDYWAAVKRSHVSTGRAMYYTSITITLGFSILALSNFNPTIYFGLFTGMAMMVALLANLTLLPVLLVKARVGG